MGPKNSYKCDLTNLLVPLIMLSLNHQNHKQWPKWGHVPYTTEDPNQVSEEPKDSYAQEGKPRSMTYLFAIYTIYCSYLLVHLSWKELFETLVAWS